MPNQPNLAKRNARELIVTVRREIVKEYNAPDSVQRQIEGNVTLFVVTVSVPSLAGRSEERLDQQLGASFAVAVVGPLVDLFDFVEVTLLLADDTFTGKATIATTDFDEDAP